MFDLCEAVKERYGQDYSETFRHITELNAHALFSSKKMNEDQHRETMDFRLMTQAYLKENIKWHKRLWLRWIKCLY